jgi:predicted esterase
MASGCRTNHRLLLCLWQVSAYSCFCPLYAQDPSAAPAQPELPSKIAEAQTVDKELLEEEEERLRLLKGKSGYFQLFDEKAVHYTGGGYRDRKFSYRLLVPTAAKPKNKLPMIVWLHGMGEKGDDNLSQLRWLQRLIFKKPYNKSDYPFFLLAIQCPDDNPSWWGGGPEQDDMGNVLVKVIEDALRDYPIDRDQVSIAGISSGGTGCWEMAAKHPDLFCAVAPMSGASSVTPPADGPLPPIWAFAAGIDSMVSVETVQSTGDRFRNAGGVVKVSVVNTTKDSGYWNHDSWTPAFNEHPLLGWLLAQRRGSGTVAQHWSWLRFNYLNWGYLWPRLAPLGILLVIALAVYRETARRRATEVASTTSAMGEPVPVISTD